MASADDAPGARLLCLLLWLAGVAGALSLLAIPLEAIKPAGLDLPPLAFRALTLINPLFLLTLLVPLGCWLAPRVGLDAPLTRALLTRSGEAYAILRRQIGPAGWVGLAVGLLLIGYSVVSGPLLAQAPAAARLELPLVSRLLYGGITEELLTRWGLMTVFVWLAVKVGLRGAAPYWVGAALAALLFAAGHLPMLNLLIPNPPPALLAMVLAGNAVPGLLFGWLFWKRGLEAAIFSHALAHLAAWTFGLFG